MKAFTLFLIAAATLTAQSLTGVPTALRNYLTLTETQVQAIVTATNSFDSYLDEQLSLQLTLNREINRELAKAQPDATVVGQKVVELEMSDRALLNRYLEVIAEMRRSLTDEQKTKMKALEDAYRLTPLIEQAQDVGLWDPQLEELGPIFLFTEKPEMRATVARLKKNYEARKAQLSKTSKPS
ncbi:MAG TPA: hypothetical protein VE621_00105 [Bryobacteraceae bacterium]|nr:hypothetical protein [Bryobacteraceae bacterium]